MLDERWKNAMSGEICALEFQRTWDLETLPPGKKAIGSQWIYKLKFNADGTIERYKARLVCLGNHQVEGEDYDETFSPVVRMTMVRTLLEVAVAKD
ncbi:Retrovirus-related Pol polyprotein from transposon RE1 [Cardamine amara subsp. amara]|uniref:Retrovirus-related Pol polyprotein from transposon RE1 n=1 Tax=Cardamine amara subsp. amara TaxID=228776 RepID=A0ABD1C6W2_CARAN